MTNKSKATMKYFSAPNTIFATSLRPSILFLLLVFSILLHGQTVLSGTRTGTIQGMHQGDGYLTISGNDYDFHNDVSIVYYNGEEVGDRFLNEGLVVRFVLNNNNMLSRIEVLGPLDLIEALEES